MADGLAVSWLNCVSTLPVSTRLVVIVHVVAAVFTFPPNDAPVLANPLRVNESRVGVAAVAVNVWPGGPALSVKSWPPLKAAAEKSGCEMDAAAGADALAVMRAARAVVADRPAATAASSCSFLPVRIIAFSHFGVWSLKLLTGPARCCP